MRPYLARKRDTLDADSLPHSIASELAHRSEPEPQKAAAYADSLVVAASATVVPVLTAASWIGAQWHWLLYATLAPLAAVYFVIALFIWFSENLGTYSRTWIYPGQIKGWAMVSVAKLGSWYLLLIISYTLVALINKPATIGAAGQRPQRSPKLEDKGLERI